MSRRRATGSTWTANGKPVAMWVYVAQPPASDVGATHVLEDPGQRARWLSATVDSLLRTLALAKLERAEVTTGSHGEDAFTVNAREVGALERLVGYPASCQDFVALSADLSLTIATPEGGPLPLPFSLTLAIEAKTDDETYAPILSKDCPFELSITVNTTLFMEATFGGNCDNRRWARANRPLLETILRATETVPGVKLSSWEANGLSDQVRHNGFSNLSDEYRLFHLGHTAKDLHYVERRSDGAEVVEISYFEFVGTELTVHYKPFPAVSTPVAVVLILEHFVPEVAGRDGAHVATIRLENLDSRRVHYFEWASQASVVSS